MEQIGGFPIRVPYRGKPSICLPAIDRGRKPPSSGVCQVHSSTVKPLVPMSSTNRLAYLRTRFAALALSSLPSIQAAPTFHPMPRPSVLCARGMDSHVLTPSERARLASELAPRRAFRASVLALPLLLNA